MPKSPLDTQILTITLNASEGDIEEDFQDAQEKSSAPDVNDLQSHIVTVRSVI